MHDLPNVAALRALSADLDRRMKEIKVGKVAAQAQHWLDHYGGEAAAGSDMRFEAFFSFASSCDGAEAAREYIEKAAMGLAGEIVGLAKRLAHSDVDTALNASVGRNAKRQDPEEGLGPKDEHAVPPEEAGDAQTPPSESPS